MTTELRVEIPDWDAFAKKMGRSKDWIAGAIAGILSKASLFAERRAREGTPKDTSALARSITSEAKPLSARVFSTLNYAVVTEEGRRSGARMPPPEALAGWLRRHGSFTTPFVLARSIARRGIKGRFFMRAAKEATEQQMPNLLNEAAQGIGREWEK